MGRTGNQATRHGPALHVPLARVGAAVALVWGTAGCANSRGGRLAIPRVAHWAVTASAFSEGGEPARAVDGDTNTCWRSGTAGPQWVQVDMARPAMVCGFSLLWGVPHATAYAVQTSPDGANWAVGYETTGGDGDRDQVSFEPVLARHLRVAVEKGAQGPGVALCELEILGLTDQPLVRVAGAPDSGTAALLDDDPATVWRSTQAVAVVELDLRSVRPVGGLRVDWGANGFASNTVVELSTNRTDWISAGSLQALTGDFDVLLNEETRPARHVRLSFSGASTANGFEVAGITLRGAEGVARPWALYELAAAKAPDGAYPEVLRDRQNYWAVAGGPRPGDPESLLDERGVFAARARGPSLTPLIFADGHMVVAPETATGEHRLGGAGAPLPEMVWRMASGLTLRIRALARSGAAPALTQVLYELENDSLLTQTGRCCWLVRPVPVPPPWAGGELASILKIRADEFAPGRLEVQVNEEPLFAVGGTNLSFGAAAFADGDVVEYFLRGETPPLTSATDEKGLASAAWWLDFSLEPGEKTALSVFANAQEVRRRRAGRFPWPETGDTAQKEADAFDRDWVDAAWAWRDATGGFNPRISRLDAMDCLRAQVGWLVARRRPPFGTGESVEAIAWRVAALLRAGRADVAREWIQRVAATIRTNGLVAAAIYPEGVPDRPSVGGAHAAQGQFAFMVLEYHRFTGDRAFLEGMYPALTNALAYLQVLRSDQERTEWLLPEEESDLVEGLLPAAAPRPGEPRTRHLYADQYWALLGWKEGRAAASLLGLEADAIRADEQYRTLKSAVHRALRAHMDRMPESWIPASAEEDRFDALSMALLFWPCEETDLVEPHELQSSLDAYYEVFLRRRPSDWSGCLSAAESALLIPLASMDCADYAREVLYALLDWRRPAGWHVWPDVVCVPPRQPGSTGFMPDAQAAAAYVIATRGLVAREAGRRLDLFAGAPAEWLQHGDGLEVFGMPTAFGPLDLKGDWEQNRFLVEIGGEARPPEGYRLWWPRSIAPDRVVAAGKSLKTFDDRGANLPHDFRGQVEAVFPASAPWPRDP